MIKINKGDVEISGVWPIIRSEFVVLVRTLCCNILTDKLDMSPAEAKEEIMDAVGDGFKTDAEAKEQAEEALKNLAELLGGFGDKLKKILEEKDEK